MALTREQARAVLDTYIQAWETQDPDLIVTIFTASATYHERVLQDPIPDRDAIRRYWQEKVARSQANIKCELLNLYLDGTTVIAEWQAEFDDLAQNVRKRMREIAVLTFEGTLISSLREYWSSERIGPVSATPSALSAVVAHSRPSALSRKRSARPLSLS
jgi:ketosteroid isomerase-like protein